MRDLQYFVDLLVAKEATDGGTGEYYGYEEAIYKMAKEFCNIDSSDLAEATYFAMRGKSL